MKIFNLKIFVLYYFSTIDNLCSCCYLIHTSIKVQTNLGLVASNNIKMLDMNSSADCLQMVLISSYGKKLQTVLR